MCGGGLWFPGQPEEKPVARYYAGKVPRPESGVTLPASGRRLQGCWSLFQ